MQRRNILGGMFAIPFLGTSDVPKSFSPPSPSWGPMPMGANSIGSNIDRLTRDVEEARTRVNYLKRMRGAPLVRESYERNGAHILCRKATSPVMKDILIREHRQKAQEQEAEDYLARALWKLGCPDWMRDFF